jgi:shikimate 5-dehydrogenase
MTKSYQTATRPTMYFIGVSTSQSLIMKIFPHWARHFGLLDAQLVGIDFPLQTEPAAYRKAVEFIKTDPLSAGALVTTHKIDLYRACRDLFVEVDQFGTLMEEASGISKVDNNLVAHAKDPISSGLALKNFIPHNHWRESGAEVFVIGAGGAAIAITWYLMRACPPENRPERLSISDRDPRRLAEIHRIHGAFQSTVRVDYVEVKSAEQNDAILARLKPGSLVINATGLGKDAPGSPLTDAVDFPEGGIVWELNYRGNLSFLDQAKAQQIRKALRIEDGWIYFIHGWTQVIAEVFHIEIPTTGPGFENLCSIAAKSSGRTAPENGT